MKEIITYITSQLIDLYPQDEAQALAWWIVEESTGLSRNEILTGCKGTKNIPNLQTIIDRLHHFEPIQYIFGHTVWHGLDLKVTPATLIPRPETAELVDRINHEEAHTNNLPLRVLDIGTGSGCIAIALKKAHPEWEVMGIDGRGVANEAPDEDFEGMPRLTPRMMARLQGFPDDWDFGKRKTIACRMIGNAFPPPVAREVGRMIKQVLDYASIDSKSTKEVPLWAVG